MIIRSNNDLKGKQYGELKKDIQTIFLLEIVPYIFDLKFPVIENKVTMCIAPCVVECTLTPILYL